MLTPNQIAQSFSNENLQLIILPTEKCNFRCTYCYEDFKVGLMKEPVIAGIESLLNKRIPTLKNLAISWFGGEPLLAIKTIKRINSLVLNSPAYINKSLFFHSEITTNGYTLNSQIFEELIDHKVSKFQISIDGPEEFHNTTRILKGGKPTFKTIWNNLLAIKKTSFSFKVNIRFHITEFNYSSSFEFLKQIEDTFLFDQRFVLNVKAIGKYGGENDDKINPLTDEYETRLQNSIKIYADAKEGSQREYICYASKPNSFVIRANGTIGKCTVALNKKINNVGNLSEKGELILDTAKLRKWSQGFFTKNIEELSCPMSKIDDY
jgi:uncharacterized protein